ncbi:hypothetical protein BV22DRAFT_1036259 [Leucogyrophana mollusca]|uniref:Uncharacterized protein n=1 Tax=Leucogyrophana mollusca TaxID=85980 RepID=A0ACB8BE72_9AGAM|nr:hypothetical protein BV22DRAFT_1036259 [Leucogyrophana mollusca]
MPGGTSEKQRGGNTKTMQSAQEKANVLYAQAREDASKFTQDANAYADQIQDSIDKIKDQRATHVRILASVQKCHEGNDELFESLFSGYPSLLEDTVRWRIREGESANKAVRSHATELHKSRMKLITNAKSYLDEGREKQRLAMDVSAFIKHYKALILSS